MEDFARMPSQAEMPCDFLRHEEQTRARREEQNATGHLFVLPAELRNEIYRLCDVDQSEPIERTFAGAEVLQPATVPTEQLQQTIVPRTGLSRTCRALRRETLSMFYGSNVFTAEIDNTSISQLELLKGFRMSDRSLLSLPEEAYWSLERVELSFRLRALSRFSQSTTNIVADLRGGHPASLRVDGEEVRDFDLVKRTLQRLLDRLNRQNRGTVEGIKREDISKVIDIMKRIIQQDRDKYPDWKRRLRAYMDEPTWMLNTISAEIITEICHNQIRQNSVSASKVTCKGHHHLLVAYTCRLNDLFNWITIQISTCTTLLNDTGVRRTTCARRTKDLAMNDVIGVTRTDAHSQNNREAHNIDNPILRLLAELRNEIYRLCLPTSTCTYAVATENLRISMMPPKDGLYQACQALRREALPMYYGHKTFTATIYTGSTGGGLNEAERWLSAVPDEIFEFLRKVQMKLELRALRMFSHSPRRIVINLKGDRSPAFVSVEDELGVMNDTRGFRVVKKKVEKFVGKVNQRNSQAGWPEGVKKEDIENVIERLKHILSEDKEYSVWSKRELCLHG